MREEGLTEESPMMDPNSQKDAVGIRFDELVMGGNDVVVGDGIGVGGGGIVGRSVGGGVVSSRVGGFVGGSSVGATVVDGCIGSGGVSRAGMDTGMLSFSFLSFSMY